MFILHTTPGFPVSNGGAGNPLFFKMLAVTLLFLFGVVVTAAPAEAFPNIINIQGKLTDAQFNALSGSHNFTFTVYNAGSGGAARYSENMTLVVTQGLWSHALGSNGSLSLAFDEDYYIEVRVNGQTLTPRVRMGAVGYAYRANRSSFVDNLSESAVATGNFTVFGNLVVWGNVSFNQTLNVTGALVTQSSICIPGQVLSTNAAGVLTCVTDSTGNSTNNGTAGFIGKFNTTISLGNSIIFENQSRIGVNTTNPTSLLHIIGSMNVSGTVIIGNSICGAGQVLTTTSAGALMCTIDQTLTGYQSSAVGWVNTTTNTSTDLQVIINSSASNGAFIVKNVTGASLFFINGSSGRIGIGTTAPSSLLTVMGDINATGNLYGTFLGSVAASSVTGDLSVFNNKITLTQANITSGISIPSTNVTGSFVTSVAAGEGLNTTTITSSGTLHVNLTFLSARYIDESQSAGGDLAGTYPSPSVVWGNGNNKLTVTQANISSGIAIGADNVTAGTFALGNFVFLRNLSINNSIQLSQFQGCTLKTNATGSIVCGGDNDSGVQGLSIPAGNVTAGTFASGNFAFPNNVSASGNLTASGVNITNAVIALPTNSITSAWIASLDGSKLTNMAAISYNILLSQANISSGIAVSADNVTAGTFALGNFFFLRNLSINNTVQLNQYQSCSLETNATGGVVCGADDTITGGVTIPAGNVTAGTFAAGNYVFPGNLTVTGNTVSNGSVLMYNDGSNGITNVTIKAGASQAAVPLLSFRDTNNAIVGYFIISGGEGFHVANRFHSLDGSSFQLSQNGNTLQASNSFSITWAPGSFGSAPDLALMQNRSGVLEINNGTRGGYADLLLRSLSATGTVFLNSTGTGNATHSFNSSDIILAGSGYNSTDIQWRNVTLRNIVDGNDSRLGVFVNGSERVSILSNGRVGIGNTTPAGVLEVSSLGASGTPLIIRMPSGSSTALTVLAPSSSAFSVTGDGTVSGSNFRGTGTPSFSLHTNTGLGLRAALPVAWASGTDGTGPLDLALYRQANGVLTIMNGTSGTSNATGSLTVWKIGIGSAQLPAALFINATNSTGGNGSDLLPALIIQNATGSRFVLINGSSGMVNISTAVVLSNSTCTPGQVLSTAADGMVQCVTDLTGSALGITIPATNVTAGTFAGGNYVFPSTVTVQNFIVNSTGTGNATHVFNSSDLILQASGWNGTHATSLNASIRGAVDANSTNSSLAFFVNGSERVRIDSQGQVGIGLRPEYSLDVNVSDLSDRARFRTVNGDLSIGAFGSGSPEILTSTGYLNIRGTDPYAKITMGHPSGSQMGIQIAADGGPSYFRGPVGINLSTPTETLHVAGNILINSTGTGTVTTSFNSSDLILAGSGYNSTAILWRNVTLRNIVQDNNSRLGIFVNGSERVSVDSRGQVGIGTTTPTALLQVSNGAILASGTIGDTPASGAGTRFMWVPGKAALRAGNVTGDRWDDANIGVNSIALGADNLATKASSVAFGEMNNVSATGALAIGKGNNVSGDYAVALGLNNVNAAEFYTFTMGFGNRAQGGRYGVAMGFGNLANNYYSLAVGLSNIADWSAVAIGDGNHANNSYSVAMGQANRISGGGTGGVALGVSNTLIGSGGVALGSSNIVTGAGAMAFMASNNAAGSSSMLMGSYLNTTDSGNYAFVIGHGINSTSRLVNSINYSLMIGFNSTTPTLFVNGSSVGIGTTTPSQTLTVVGDINATGNLFGTFAGAIAYQNNAAGWTNTTANITTDLQVFVNNSSPLGSFVVRNTTGTLSLLVNGSSGDVVIGNNKELRWGLGSGGNSMIMRLDNSNNLRMTSPAALTIAPASANFVTITDSTFGTTLARFGDDASVTLGVGGRVFWSTGSPVAVSGNLMLNSTGSGNATHSFNSSDLILAGSGYNSTAPLWRNVTLRNIVQDNNSRLGVFVNGSERFVIDSRGYVGVGDSSPTATLYVHDTLNASQTTLTVQAAPNQSAGGSPLFRVMRSDGSTQTDSLIEAVLSGSQVILRGSQFSAYATTTPKAIYAGDIRLASDMAMGFSSSTTVTSAANDIQIARNASGVLEINNGTTRGLADVLLRNLNASGNISGTFIGTFAGSVPASSVTAGTFGAGNYAFSNNVTVTQNLILNSTGTGTVTTSFNSSDLILAGSGYNSTNTLWRNVTLRNIVQDNNSRLGIFVNGSERVGIESSSTTFYGNILSSSDGTISIGAPTANRPAISAYGIELGSNTVPTSAEIRLGVSPSNMKLQPAGVLLGSGVLIGWSSGDAYGQPTDTGVFRAGSGMISITNGTRENATGSLVARSIALGSIQLPAQLFINATNSTGGNNNTLNAALIIENATGSTLLYVNGSSGRIGIGMAPVNATLDVNGGVYVFDRTVGVSNLSIRAGANQGSQPLLLLQRFDNSMSGGTYTSVVDSGGTSQLTTGQFMVANSGGAAFYFLGTSSRLRSSLSALIGFTPASAATSADNDVAFGRGGPQVITVTNGTLWNATGSLTARSIAVGSAELPAQLYINATNSTGGNNNTLNPALIIENATGSRFVYVNGSSGNVGIKTDIPAVGLDVNTTAQFTGNTTFVIPAGDTQVCFERFQGTQFNYSRCINSTGHVTERVGVFPL